MPPGETVGAHIGHMAHPARAYFREQKSPADGHARASGKGRCKNPGHAAKTYIGCKYDLHPM